jgi:drug/metabolite transporter (DMT)-like permease
MRVCTFRPTLRLCYVLGLSQFFVMLLRKEVNHPYQHLPTDLSLFSPKKLSKSASADEKPRMLYLCPMDETQRRAYLTLHICVLIWGFTAILGKLIQLNALHLVWWRVLLCGGALLFIIRPSEWRTIGKREVCSLLGIGLIVGLHWWSFYGSIKLANASVAVTSVATITLFSAILEPLILRQPFKWVEIGFGLLILPGIALVAGQIDWSMRTGFAVGVLSALLAALFSTLNKRMINRYQPSAFLMTFWEMTGGWLICSLILLAQNNGWETLALRGNDRIWVPVLAFCCTLLPFWLSLRAMRYLSVFTTNLTINLEPVYAIVLAAILFREDQELTPGFYLGVLILLAAVFGHPLLMRLTAKQGQRQSQP